MKTKQVTPTFGLCIDWETSGALWGGDSSKDHQGLAIGAVVFNTSDFSVVEKLYLEIKFDGSRYTWTESAEKIHGMSREYLEQNGVTQEEAAAAIAELILKYWGPSTSVMFLGHNPGFDIRFTAQLLATIGIEFSVERNTDMSGWIQVHHVVLDTSATGFITLGLFKSDLLFEKIGFEERGAHNALTDALQTVATCAAIRQMMQIAMGE